jgi:5-(carboxyamino)imidazole ribonucleotide mutase
MKKNFIAILMGSDSDLTVMQHAGDVFKSLQIPYEMKITSAHRTPARTIEYVEEAQRRGCAAFICGAGLAAHLAGVVAAHTVKPVIGVPLEAGGLNGLDALLSTVQMPGGIPVACVAIGKPGAQNAAYLCAEILGLQDEALSLRLQEMRRENAKKIAEKDAALSAKLAQA